MRSLAAHPGGYQSAKSSSSHRPSSRSRTHIAVVPPGLLARVSTAEACVRALCFGRSAASPVEALAATMAPGSSWARRGLRLERPSEDFGTVVTQAPVTRFPRTPAVAGDTPRIFGKGQPDGWTQ